MVLSRILNATKMQIEKQQLIPRYTGHCTKTRAILNPEHAIKIYQIKLSNHNASQSQRLSSCSVARAVRDIWKGRTWLRETKHLDFPCVKPQFKQSPLGPPCHQINVTSSRTALCPDSASHKIQVSAEDGEVQHRTLSLSLPAANICHPGRALSSQWWDQVTTTCSADARFTKAAIDSILLGAWGWPSTTTEAAPLPVSSRPDDPFHDDWRYWPTIESGTGSACCAF